MRAGWTPTGRLAGPDDVRHGKPYGEGMTDTRRGELSQIGQVAERTGLSLGTIRFYEENGLVVPTARTEGGFRLYSEDDVARLEVIKRMKPLGFTLEEMQELFRSCTTSTRAPGTVRSCSTGCGCSKRPPPPESPR
jgi:hypothetical protein